MLGKHRLAVDHQCEAYWFLEPYADETFGKWHDVNFRSDTTYVIGRGELINSRQDILAVQNRNIVLSYAAEGANTIIWQLKHLDLMDLVLSGKVGLIYGGNRNPHLNIDAVVSDFQYTNISTFDENKLAHQEWQKIYQTPNKPYSFLMLSGRLRPHRKYFIDVMRARGLLDQALWTNLQSQIDHQNTSLALTATQEPIRLLPSEYEFKPVADQYDAVANTTGWIKSKLFGSEVWYDGRINPAPYIDTYFSLVTETVFEYPCSFRTEKIFKPILMCQPFVVASNPGYYKDLHDRGFQTFGDLIDEGFDRIDDHTNRAQRIVDVVAEICYNPNEFLQAAKPMCEHNYQRLLEYHEEEKLRLALDLQCYLDRRSV
jgi:hypothetical protein